MLRPPLGFLVDELLTLPLPKLAEMVNRLPLWTLEEDGLWRRNLGKDDVPNVEPLVLQRFTTADVRFGEFISLLFRDMDGGGSESLHGWTLR